MKKENIETPMNISRSERIVISSFLRRSENVEGFIRAVINEPSLIQFFLRNFQNDETKIEKWIKENFSETVTATLSHGTLEIELENLEYELDEDETVEDIDWDEVAQDHSSSGYGYSEFDWNENDVETVKSFDLEMSEFDDLKEVA